MSSFQSQNFLSSREHLIGCISVIVGYLMIWTGIITWSWFTVLIIFYTIAWLISSNISSESNTVSHNKTIKSQSGLIPQNLTTNASDTWIKNQFIDDFLKLQYAHQRDLPFNANEILKEIHKVLIMLNKQIPQRNDLFTIEIHNVQKIVNQYLLPTIQNYLNVPSYYASHRIIKDNKTAQDLLIEQLNLLKEELYTILDNILSDNLTALTLHGEFLQKKLKPYQFFKTHDEEQS